MGGIGITAILTDLIAVRLRSTALAGLPLLVLFIVPVTMNAQKQSIGTLVVFCLGTTGYLAMLSADGRERIRVWGRLVSLWRQGGSASSVLKVAEAEPGPDTRALAAAGLRVGLASVVLALCVPLIVPGLHPGKLLSSATGTGGGSGPAGSATGGVSLALPSDLKQTVTELEGPPTTVFSYTTSDERLWSHDPPYFQQVVYDDLNDTQSWVTSDVTKGETPVTQAGALPGAQGLADAVRAAAQTVGVTVNVVAKGGLSSPREPTFLPAPYPPSQVSAPPGGWRADRELMVFSQDKSIAVQTYEVTSYLVDPSNAQLKQAPPPPPEVMADEQLPKSYQVLKEIAQAETQGATTEWDKVNLLADWLSYPPFSYGPAPYFDSAAGLIKFLTTTRTGVCVQYAYALTVLARSLGIPARLVVGYTEGTHVSGNKWVVKSSDAHAWTQAYFSGYGWITFEATPAGGDGSAHAGRYQTKPSRSNQFRSPPPISATAQPSSSSTRPAGFPGNRYPRGGGGGTTSGGLSARSSGIPWAAIVLALIAAIALACGVIAIMAPPAQRARSSRPADGPRRRSPATFAAALLVAAAIAAFALRRLLSDASGLGLGGDWATVGIVFGAACAVTLVVPSLTWRGLRRWRWRQARDDASRAHAAWRDFRDDLQDLGVRNRPSEPPRTLADRVGSGLPEPAREAVRRLALAEERASYAARPAQSESLRRDGTTARRGVAASVGRRSRWRASMFPASAITAVADLAARIPSGLADLVSRRWTERGSTS